MFKIDSFVLYVDDIEISKKFYTDTFECEGQVLSPTFVSFPLGTEVTIELKQIAQAEPSATITGGGTELSLVVENPERLHKLYDQWKLKGVTFLQVPTELVFGLTFVAIDPDEHRIRVFAHK
ncbi:MAG: VOC family protein [Aliivibrio sp.]|uniref:VOC family protein n=1 Tax=Aliivibrio sp. TaxID=1872443 RepID=UPI001A4E8F11|nr:VOC family protein [Aliivibrio sp.]